MAVALFVSTISSKLEHEPFVIVQRRVTLLPVTRPVTVLLSDAGEVIVAPFAEPITLHKPEPVIGVLAASVKFPELHNSWSGPAAAVVGNALLVMVTTSEVEQEPLLIVQRSVTLLPTGTPVTVVVGDAVFVTVAVPASIVHNPLPRPGEFAASVNVDVVHNV